MIMEPTQKQRAFLKALKTKCDHEVRYWKDWLRGQSTVPLPDDVKCVIERLRKDLSEEQKQDVVALVKEVVYSTVSNILISIDQKTEYGHDYRFAVLDLQTGQELGADEHSLPWLDCWISYLFETGEYRLQMPNT